VEFLNKDLHAHSQAMAQVRGVGRLKVLILTAQACQEGCDTNQKSNNPCKWAKSSTGVKELSKYPQEADSGPFFMSLDDCYILQKTKHNLQGERKDREWDTGQSGLLSALTSLLDLNH